MWPRADRIAPAPWHAGHVLSATGTDARAAARAAGVAPDERHARLGPAHRLLEAERHRRVQVGAVHARLGRARPRCRESRRRTGRRRSTPTARSPTATEKSNPSNPNVAGPAEHGRRHAERVVLAPALRIGEDLVRLGDRPEPHGGRAVARVDVRVIPPRQPPVRALDLVKLCVARARRAGRRGPSDQRSGFGLRIASGLDFVLLPLVHHFRVDHVAVVATRAVRRARRPPPRRPRRPARRRAGRRLLVERLGRLVLRRRQLLQRALDGRRRRSSRWRFFTSVDRPPRSPALSDAGTLSPMSFSIFSAP